jgi:hypothetical protein
MNYDLKEFAEFTKAYAKSFTSNTNLIFDYEMTKFENYLKYKYQENDNKYDVDYECLIKNEED